MKLIQYTLAILFCLTFCSVPALSQIVRNGQTYYGNEWINYEQQYLKIKVGADGIFQLTPEQLNAAGFPVADIDASEYRLYWLGQEQRLHCTKTSGALSEGDFLAFYGEKNRSQVDRYLFSDPDRQMLNPEYGLTSDTSVYFLTWTPGSPSQIRYQLVENDLGNSFNKLDWYLHHEKLVFHSAVFKARLNSAGVRYSTYGEGEGFGSGPARENNFTLEANQISSSGTDPKLHIRMTGNTEAHDVQLKWNGNDKAQLLFAGINQNGGSILIDTSFDLSIDELKATNNLSSKTSGGSDLVVFGMVELSYPRQLSFQQEMVLDLELQMVQDGAYLEIENFNHGGMEPYVYDLTDGSVLSGIVEGNLVKINLPPGSINRKISLVNKGNIFSTRVEPVQFDNLQSSDAQFIIISHQALFEGNNIVQQYADYRSSPMGGGYQTKIIEIQQLVDQFAYGVAKHPLSIKNFSNYIYHENKWTDARFLFLIGKGLDYPDSRSDTSIYNFLPVYGYPGSDNLLVSEGENSTPLIPVGRLAARNPDQVSIYLDKIKTMEDLIATAPQTVEDRAWMKKILHLGGGVGQGEVTQLRENLNGMKKIIESSKLLPIVSTFSTQSQDVLDFNEGETVLDLINSGVMIKTYFGHGSVTTTQFNGFEDPLYLKNKDRYSVMLSLGCYTGNLYTHAVSLGEANIFAPDKGATVYMATSGLGYLTSLDIFGREWYDLVGNQMLNEPIGVINQKVIQDYDQVESVAIKTLLQQITMHGDPAFQLSKVAAPDFIVDLSSVRFDPQIINTNQDSFKVNFNLYNLGKYSAEEIDLTFSQKVPNGQIVPLASHRIKMDNFNQQVSFNLPVVKNYDLQGINRLYLDINKDQTVDELPDPAAYNNNSLTSEQGELGIRIPIVSNAVIPLSPLEYSIVNNSEIELIASTSDPLAKTQDFIFQLDTSLSFNSPLFSEYRTTQSGGLLKWIPSVSWQQNVVYYWRVGPDSTASQDFMWMHSSFTYIPDSPEGWCQSHYQQFLDGKNQGLGISENHQFSFDTAFNEIKIKNARKNGDDSLEFFYDGQQFGSPLGSPIQAAISMIVINPFDQSWFINDGASHGSELIPGENNLYSYDVSKPESRNAMIKFLDDIVPDGFYVIMYTHLKDNFTSFEPQTWAEDSLIYGENLFAALERHGAKLIRRMENLGTVPYNFLFEKNGKVLAEDIAYSNSESIVSIGNVPYLRTEGIYQSTPIGPASSWQELNWNYEWSDNPEDDQIQIALYGLTSPDADPVELMSPFVNKSTDISTISASEYPYLQLQLIASDLVKRTTPSLTNWKIYYEGLPDIAFNPSVRYEFLDDTTTIGNDLSLQYLMENISNYDMDSVLVSYTITDPKNNTHTSEIIYPPLVSKGSFIADYSYSTEQSISGPHLLTVNINPLKNPDESTYVNNLLIQRFNLEADQINPVLDITFDGIHIMNGDIVSPSPIIKISLKDENRNLLLRDSSLFDLYLIDPDGSRVTLSYDDPDILFTPAENSDNIAIIELSKTFTKDGVYELSVNAKDASGNSAGKSDLKIQFEVITRTSARHVVPYPNPFTEHTRFLYTITGSVPEVFKIQIYTVDGSVIKEINLTQEESLKIGTHLTDYVWDGTDNYNDRLANGIYLYRVILKDDHLEDFEHIESSIDPFFEKNIGKIVILR